MSLEKSTPYRNAWYRDLLEKEKELKEYTDEKVAQAIELPEVTSEDDGDVLQVIDGAWSKSTPPKGIMTFTCTSDATPTLDNDKTIADIVEAYNNGYLVLVKKGVDTFVVLRVVNNAPILINGYVSSSGRYITYLFGSNAVGANTFSVFNSLCLAMPTAENKTIISTSNNWVETDFPEPLKSIQFVNGQALSDDDYASIKANTNVRGIYSDASKYIIFELSSCNFMQTEFEFVNYAERLKANISTNKVVTITQIPVASSPTPIGSTSNNAVLSAEGETT